MKNIYMVGIGLVILSVLPIFPNPWYVTPEFPYGGKQINFWTWLSRQGKPMPT